MKRLLFSVGTLMTIIFGGGFLIRFVRDSDFSIAEFVGGILGITLICIAVSIAGKSTS
ncbi:hypothetical protein VBD025_16480 [Virgibacillus flavescens]|uniref:hypothetical protein n=1 Tax=Virgibacillus flavescens TaxID=1611422 RepID=UPI003D349797